MEKYGRARQTTHDNMIWCMRFACWITKATDTHSQYVILTASPWQQWLRERPLMLRYTYNACLVCIKTEVLMVTKCSEIAFDME
jgi:hypothetical protein